ncbi:transposase [Pseudomonas sp. H22_DOA]|nr:transposase [Pseudomonas sp. H22_DOA]
MRQRSSYPKSFKAQVVQECPQPSATISGVAISHGINANAFESGCRCTVIRRQRCIRLSFSLFEEESGHLATRRGSQPSWSSIVQRFIIEEILEGITDQDHRSSSVSLGRPARAFKDSVTGE